MRSALVSTLFGAALCLAAPGAAQQAPSQWGSGNMEAGARLCRRTLPAARRFIGRPERVARARFRAPPGIMVRFCLGCTMDYRPNRMTFALNRYRRVQDVTCG